mgnify:CR=1 FL=1
MKTFVQYKKIKKGQITKLIKTKRLRDDISCDIAECFSCENNSKILTTEHPIIFLTEEVISTQMDALENFKIIDNCIIPQSEYNKLLQTKNDIILKRLKLLIENRNFLIFANEYHSEIALIKDEEKMSQIKRNKIILSNTINYFQEHIMNITNDFNIYIILKDEKEINSIKSLLNIDLSNIKFFNMFSFGKEMLKSSPDLFNFISFQPNLDIENKMEIEEENINKNIYEKHLEEKEMKSNIKKGKMYQGKIYFQNNILDTAIVKSNLFDKDIVIEGDKNLNRAMHGDIVCFSLYEETKWKKDINIKLEEEGDEGIEQEDNIQDKEMISNITNIKQKISKTNLQPTGYITGILRRNRTIFCGTIYNPKDTKNNSINDTLSNFLKNYKKNNIAIFIPIDSKYPNFIIQLYEQEKYYNQRIVIKYDDWLENILIPSGHFFKNLGKCLDVPVENEIILYEHNVDINPFSKKIIDSMPDENIEFKCPPEELKKRIDLRDKPVCSIDPPGCKDIDDALHAIVLPNGNYELGVHIADVSHYVKAGSVVDKIAAKNCNTIYLVHKRTDMLPKVLTENLCSLVGKKERLAFSVLWEFDKDTLEIKNVKYGKSVIKSLAALEYGQAQNILNDPNDDSIMAKSIKIMDKITRHLKQQRLEAGALILSSNSMKFNLDNETNTITDISEYKTYQTNSLVEECMLLANVWVAKKIYESFPSCAILRRHPPPKEKELNNFIKILKERGFELKAGNNMELNNSLDNINKKGDPFFNKLVRSLLTRTMNQAKYFPSCEFSYEEFYHYGLAMEIYTHFTSPIRRYSDILVHRLLSAALENDYLPMEIANKVKMNKECTQMNRQNRVGFFCGQDSNYFSAFTFFKEHENKSKTLEVVIHNIDEKFIKAMSVEYGIEGNLEFDKIGGIENIDPIKKTFKLKNGETVELFDHIICEIVTTFFNYRYEIKYFYVKKI